MKPYINKNNELIIPMAGFIYRIGTPKKNKRAVQALKYDKEKGLITELEYMEAMDKLRNNLR
jgi:hypothetical protein